MFHRSAGPVTDDRVPAQDGGLRYCQGGLDMFQAGYELDSNRRYTDAIRARLPSAWTRLLNAMPGSCRSPARSVTLYPLATLTARVD